MSLLPPTDLETITTRLNRPPNPVEEGCFLNLWSEHCSYRSSAKHLRTPPTVGDRVRIGHGDDAAIVRLKCDLFEYVSERITGYGNYIGRMQGMNIRVVAAR